MIITEKDLSKYFGDDTSRGQTCDCYNCQMKDEVRRLIKLEKDMLEQEVINNDRNNFC